MNTTKPASQNDSGRSHVSDDTILKIAKEITVKFIEVGRVTPTTFDDSFHTIYNSIKTTVRNEK